MAEIDPVSGVRSTGISGLEALLKAQGGQGLPPVERWNPP